MVKRLKTFAPLFVVFAVVFLSACTAVASTATVAPDSALSPADTPLATLQQTSAQQSLAQQTETGVTSTESSTRSAVAALEGTLADIYDAVNPSVVHIQVTSRTDSGSIGGTGGFLQQGSGSGFVWDLDGNIVTNNHVVDGAERITVTFSDGTIASGEVVGTDPDSDLAVVHVDVPADDLRPIVVADSNALRVGQLAIAIGNPFSYQGTMTTGIVSAVGRLLSADSSAGRGYSIPDVVQTDAAINPGNSGGVLLDSQGRLIGVPTAIISPSQSNSGVGFAVPSSVVAKVVPVLIDKRAYEHPWLGVSVRPLTPALAEEINLDADQQGILIGDVMEDSPASRAGLRGSTGQAIVDGRQESVGGDVIVAIDGTPIRDSDDLISQLFRSTEVGQTVTLSLFRGGNAINVDVTLAARPTAPTSAVESFDTGTPWIGIRGLTLSPEIAEAMGLPADQEGALIVDAIADGPAGEAGLLGSDETADINGQTVSIGGDVIIGLNGVQITGMESLRIALIEYQPGDDVSLTVLRGGDETTVSVTVGERPLGLR